MDRRAGAEFVDCEPDAVGDLPRHPATRRIVSMHDFHGTPDDLPPVTLTTDANGGYSYGGAITGQNYRIVETQPTGLANGQENPTNTIVVTNLPASGSSGNDFGERAASLSGNVWLDANNNGVRDAGENEAADAVEHLGETFGDVMGG